MAGEKLVRRALEAIRQPAAAPREGIRAYHSSPHDFDRFDLSKIGTGEGNQAYGHGLYVAESPKVSGQGGDYWRQFWNKMPSGPERSAATALFANKFDRDKAIDHLLRDVDYNSVRGIPGKYGDGPDVEEGHRLLAQEAQQALDILKSGQIAGPRTYEVNINARPEQFLDYDKPLAQQSDSVQKALRSIDIADESVWPRISGHDAYEMLRVDSMGDDAFLRDQAYRLARRADAGAGASTILREAGIPGIKYFDAGSRDAGEGTRNYVVFDDKLIDIMKKYGLPMMTAGAGAASMADQPGAAMEAGAEEPRQGFEIGGPVDYNDAPNYALDAETSRFNMGDVFAPLNRSLSQGKNPVRAENIPLARPVAPPEPDVVNRALNVVRAEPRPMDIKVSRQAPPTPRPVPRPAPRPAPAPAAAAPDASESRRLWEIYNETGNPADFVRASNAMRAGRAEGGEVREGYDKGGIAKKAIDAARRIMGYTDPPTKKIEDWQWRPLADVDKELGLREIPPHVQQFGDYMREMVDKGRRGEISDRDLIKAYTTTRASIQRRAADTDAVREASGLPLFGAEKKIRPEGAWSEWLMSPAGQKYLDRAVKGEMSEDTVESALSVMRKFGLAPTQIEAMDWAAKNLPGRSQAASDLVYRAGQMDSPVSEWREFTSDVKGVGPAKSGFVASLLGRGDLPTLDARQVILNTGLPTDASQSFMGRSFRGQKSFGAQEGVDRLAARQGALGLEAPSKYDPFYQHLAHHTIWDKASNEKTTHADIINAMRNAGIVLGVPAAGAAVMPEDQPVERASGGRLLEDEYPTHYLPNVGRQVMADGGEPTAQSRRRATLEQLGSFEDRPPMDPAVMGQNWANAVRNFRDRPLREGEATMRPLELGARDVIGGAIAGDGGITRGRLADIVVGSRGLPGSGTLGMGVADLTPAGIPLAISDFSDALRNEDYLSAGLSAGLPAAYYARKPIMAAGRAVYDAGARAVDTARDVLGRVPAPVAAGGAGAAVMAPEEAEASKLNLVRRGLEAARGVRAYHGSPHDFDRFDLSKIGTGEGAQAYGHGLYFAENEGVARGYRDQLSGNRYVPKIPSNEIAQKYGEDVANIFEESAGSRGDITRTLARLQNIVARDLYDAGVKKISDIDGSFNPLFAEELRKVNDRAERLASLVRSKDVDLSKGHMYEVGIRANPEQFLDWDRPLAQQGSPVNEGVNSIIRLTGRERETLPTRSVYEMLGSPQEASSRLREAGIPGIRYLDAGSRGAGEGSSNYVVFDDKLIDILRKYGIPVMASGAGAAAMGEGREQ
jgi:hypothetical protein